MQWEKSWTLLVTESHDWMAAIHTMSEECRDLVCDYLKSMTLAVDRPFIVLSFPTSYFSREWKPDDSILDDVQS